MKYGAHSLMFTPKFTKDDLGLIAHAKSLGLDGLEIHLDDLSVLPIDEIKKELKKNQMEATFTAVLDKDHDFISPDPEVRQSGIDFIKRRLEIVAELGGDVLGGVNYAAWGKITGQARTKDEWEWCKECLNKIGQIAKPLGVVMALEPVNRYETHFLNTVEDARRLVEEVNHPNIRIHLDTYHCNIEEKSFYEAIKTCGEYLYHVHVCENDRGVPGTGHVNWDEVFKGFKEIGYDRWCVVESFVPDVEEVARLTAIWRQVAPSAEAIVTEGLRLFRRLE